MRLASAALILGFAAAGCSSGHTAASTPTPAPPTTSSQPAATTMLDAHAVSACTRLHKAIQIEQSPGRYADLDSGLEEYQARLDAQQSTVPGLREVMKGYDAATDDGSHISGELRDWCATNWNG